MTKLTITGRAETIIGILQKLEICDAQWNINEGFTVALDTTDPENDTPSEPAVKTPHERSGRKKKEAELSSCKYGPKKCTCRMCGKQFHFNGGSTMYCPECMDTHGELAIVDGKPTEEQHVNQ